MCIQNFQLNSAPDDVAVRNIAMGACDVLLDCGYTKPLSQLKLNDVPQLIKLAALHSTVLRIKSELDQFITGISEAGCLHAIQEYSALFIPMFVASDNIKLNAGDSYDLKCTACCNKKQFFLQISFWSSLRKRYSLTKAVLHSPASSPPICSFIIYCMK